MVRSGREEREEGKRLGIQQGEKLTIIKLVRSKLANGFEIMGIADILEEPADVIRRIADIVVDNPMISDEEIVKNYL